MGPSTGSADTGTGKPRLLLLRASDERWARFLRAQLDEQVACLAQWFDVAVVDTLDCDYKVLCDRHQPQIALFESGVYSSRDGVRRIRNVDAYPDIPRVGFCHCDAWARERVRFLSDMWRWRIDTFVTTSVALAEYTPEIASRLFVWPNFVNPDLFRDYGEPKLIPLLFTGSVDRNYPWRNEVRRRLSPLYPALTIPHLGWLSGTKADRMVTGERYARLLNASQLVPACGTIVNEVVRKHFEAPACNACLVAPRLRGLEAAGFLDMENCVLGDEGEVVDKIGHLLEHPDELARISKAGHQLVHSRHTCRQRDQIYSWYLLNRSLRSGQTIVQPGPFEPLAVVPAESREAHRHLRVDGLDRQLLRAAKDEMRAGRLQRAEAFFTRCLSFQEMPEPTLGLAQVRLLAGDPQEATRILEERISSTLNTYKAATPDPVEWAYLIIARLCEGRMKEAVRCADAYPGLTHTELDRARLAAFAAAGRVPPAGEQTLSAPAYSVHSIDDEDIRAWARSTRAMLSACRQAHIAEFLDVLPAMEVLAPQVRSARSSHRQPGEGDRSIASRWGMHAQHVSIQRIAAPIRRIGKRFLQGIERQTRYFLPYALSSAKADELFAAVEQLSERERLRLVTIWGTPRNHYLVQACLSGASRNPCAPAVHCADARGAVDGGHDETPGPGGAVVWGEETMAVIAGAAGRGNDHTPAGRPTIVVVTDIDKPLGASVSRGLAADRGYMLMAHRVLRRSYAVFRRISGADDRPPETLVSGLGLPEQDHQ